MFLAGLKFALGLICGLSSLSVILVGFLVCAELVMTWRKRRAKEYADRRLLHRAELATSRRKNKVVVLRIPGWLDEAEKLNRRKTEYLQ